MFGGAAMQIGEAHAGVFGGGVEAVAVVAEGEDDVVVGLIEGDVNLGGGGVAGDVVQGFFEHQHEVALAVHGEAAGLGVVVEIQRVLDAAQHAVGGFA